MLESRKCIQQVGEAEDRLLPLLPKLQRESMGAANGEAGPSSPAPGSGAQSVEN